eukprot:11249882-Ditylum_brightwellii.AAC.1
MSAETMTNMWKKIGYADKSGTENNITSISIPDTWPDISTPILADNVLENPKTATTWHKADLPDKILHYLTVHNCCHFGQAHNTPFTARPCGEVSILYDLDPCSRILAEDCPTPIISNLADENEHARLIFRVE